MRKFSHFIVEVKKNYEIDAPSAEEVSTYLNKTKSLLPVDVKKTIELTKVLGLFSAEDLDKIREAKKPSLKDLVDVLNVSLDELQSLWQLFKEMKGNYKLMPQYISKSEREMIIAGKMDVMDVLIDTETKQGREAIIKQFSPLIMSIVNKFDGVSWMDRSDLVSACHEYLVDAINKYERGPNSKTGKASSFRSFVKSHITNLLKNEISKHGHSLSGTNSYAVKNNTNIDATRIDALMGKDGEIDPDHWDAMGVEDPSDVNKESKPLWNRLYSLLSKKFSERDMDMFFSFYGLNGRQPMDGRELAKKYNRTYELIMDKNGPIKKILRFMRENPKLMDLLNELRDLYTESLICKLVGSRAETYEQLISNDAYVLLETSSRWSDGKIFKKDVNNALSKSQDREQLTKILGGDFMTIDDNIKKYKKSITNFLYYMYPTENVSNLKDMDLIEYMLELQQYYHKYNK